MKNLSYSNGVTTILSVLVFGFAVFYYSILLLLYSVQHWRSTATCAAALELPNLNYVHGTELTLKPKDK